MANKVITDIDLGSVEYRDGEFIDALVNFSGAGTYPAGTVLAAPGGGTTNYPVPVDGAYIPWVHSATPTGEANFARAVLPYDVEATGVGDVPCRVLVRGVVNRARLRESTPSASALLTAAEADAATKQLAANSITAVGVDELGRTDNPNNP